MRHVNWLALGCGAAGLLSCGEAMAPDTDTPIEATRSRSFMATPLGTAQGDAVAINEAGQVVGTRYTGGDRAFVWYKGMMTYLAELSGIQGTMATAINNRGQVVGASPTTGFPHAVLWARGVIIDLGTLPGAVYSLSVARAINERSQVVGESSSAIDFGNDHAVVWEDGKIRDLGAPPRGVSYAMGINDRGEIAGWTQAYDAYSRATLWTHGATIDLGLLQGAVYSNAYKVNNRGQVVGYSGGYNGNGYWQHAVLWDHGKITDLGTLPGGSWSGASAINAAGLVAGWTNAADGQFHAVVWRDGVIRDLGIGQAFGINNRGQVVGFSGGRPTLWSVE